MLYIDSCNGDDLVFRIFRYCYFALRCVKGIDLHYLLDGIHLNSHYKKWWCWKELWNLLTLEFLVKPIFKKLLTRRFSRSPLIFDIFQEMISLETKRVGANLLGENGILLSVSCWHKNNTWCSKQLILVFLGKWDTIECEYRVFKKVC